MRISYNGLWNVLANKKLRKEDFCEMARIDVSTLLRLESNRQVSMDTLMRICRVLNCSIENIAEFTNT